MDEFRECRLEALVSSRALAPGGRRRLDRQRIHVPAHETRVHQHAHKSTNRPTRGQATRPNWALPPSCHAALVLPRPDPVPVGRDGSTRRRYLNLWFIVNVATCRVLSGAWELGETLRAWIIVVIRYPSSLPQNGVYLLQFCRNVDLLWTLIQTLAALDAHGRVSVWILHVQLLLGASQRSISPSHPPSRDAAVLHGKIVQYGEVLGDIHARGTRHTVRTGGARNKLSAAIHFSEPGYNCLLLVAQ